MARIAEQKRIRQSAVIPYRWRGGQLQVLLITRRSNGEWIVPKGSIEPDMTAYDSAAKEAEEEAGVLGRVGTQPIGSFEYEKWSGPCIVRVYDLEVRRELSDWPEKRDRTRRWVDAGEAPSLVRSERLGELIALLPRRLSHAKPT